MSMQLHATRLPASVNGDRRAVLAARQPAPSASASRAARSLRRADGVPQQLSRPAMRRGVARSRGGSSRGPMASADSQLRVMIFGAPAAGKGTQCATIVEKYGLVHISVGDLLRAEVAAGTPAGKKAKAFMDAGDLVPNEVVVEMVKTRMAQDDVRGRGWLLDGYPRSLEQAEAIEAEGIRPDVFLLINVPDQVLIERVTGRRLDPDTGDIYHMKFKPPPAEVVSRLTQRSDDTEEKVANRLATYHRNLESVLGMYSDAIVHVDGNLSFDAVFEQIQTALDAKAAATAA